MENFNLSTYMNLPIPTPTVDPGPDYAFNLVNSLTLVDSHNHSSGQGQQITPLGMNINSDLSFQGNNLILARSLRLTPQISTLSNPSDLGCLYEVGTNLYFNNGSGVPVQITNGSSLAGTQGSIANLASPASATYVSGNTTFVWQSNANTPANMDAASYIFRNLSAGSFGLTLQPPISMASNFSVTLPSLPGAQSLMQMDTSGNITASVVPDNSSLQISGGVLGVKPNGITQYMRATMGVSSSAGAGQFAQSASYSGTLFSTSLTSIGLSVTLTTTGRPIRIFLRGQPPGESFIEVAGGSGPTALLVVYKTSGSYLSSLTIGSSASNSLIPPSAFEWWDFQPAGAYSYTLYYQVVSSGGTGIALQQIYLCAYEI